MKTTIAIVIIFIGILTFGINTYLTPDDIDSCKTGPSEVKNCEIADAIVAVSGGDTSARAREAIKLYKAGWASTLIFSGAAEDKTGPSNAQVMTDLAINEGVPPRDIISEESSETTAQNAVKTQAILEENDIKSIILVTSPYHERRARMEFEKVSRSVSIRSHPTSDDSGWSSLWWLTPSGWYLALSELVKIGIMSTGSPTAS
jgi:uncharacterized SAM-binding protein YcdF (DUF218 family)